MKFLANENFPFPSVKTLRDKGFEVISISETYSGIADSKVIEIALEKELIILTFDKDYGELIYRKDIVKAASVVFFRYKGTDPKFAANQLLSLIKNNITLENSFTVIDQESIRQRKY